MSSDKLILFTRKYPYEEIEFLDSEILELSKKFNEVIIVPTLVTNLNIKFETPDNVKVLPILWNDYKSNKIKFLIRNIKPLIHLFLKELINSGYNIRSGSSIINSGTFSYYLFLKFSEIIENNGTDPILYSFWMNENAIAISLYKKKSLNRSKFVIRSHGYDLYDERRPSGYIPFRKLAYENADKIVPISKDGWNYIVNKYREDPKKVCVSRLGSEDYGIGEIPSSDYISIVSCSTIDSVKRVNKIVDVLTFLKVKTKWTHFGDGDLDNLIEYATKRLQENVICNFTGQIPLCQIIEFYKSTPVDTFINLSNYEGIPVSIMEAISFGIPIIGNDVGGVREIVNYNTGILFTSEESPKYIANKLEYDFFKIKTRKKEFRDGVRKFWIKNFSAHKNYNSFVNNVLLDN